MSLPNAVTSAPVESESVAPNEHAGKEKDKGALPTTSVSVGTPTCSNCRVPMNLCHCSASECSVCRGTKDLCMCIAALPIGAPPKKPWERGYTPPPPSAPAHQSPTTAAGSNEALTEQAVRFLLHESVIDTPLATKRAFLEAKGLSAAQIDNAVKRAAARGDDAHASTCAAAAPTAALPATAAPTAAAPAAADGGWNPRSLLLLGGAVGAAAIGAVAYAVASLHRREHGSFLHAQLPVVGSDQSGDAPAPEEAPAAAAEPSTTPSTSTRLVPTTTPSTRLALNAMREELRRPDALPNSPPASLPAFQTPSSVLLPPPPPVPPPGVTHERAAALGAALDAFEAGCTQAAQPAAFGRALHTLVMLLSGQVRRPRDVSYHRLNVQNANVRQLLALPRAAGVLGALGFLDAGGAFWLWTGTALSSSAIDEPSIENAQAQVGGDGPSQDHALVPTTARIPSEEELRLIQFHKEVLAWRLEMVGRHIA